MRKSSGLGVREIAAKLSLNISTVSRALNNSSLISRETAALVQRTAKEMGYQSPRSKRCIAVILPHSRTGLAWYMLNLINALTNVLSDKDHYWEFINADRLAILPERSLSGIISIDFSSTAAYEISQKYLLPLVCINDAPRHLDSVYCVNSDARSAIELAFRHLRTFGHRKIAYIGMSETSFEGKFRKEVFTKMTQEYDLAKDCLYLSADGNGFSGIVRSLYRNGFTSIIADGESSGLAMLDAVRNSDLKIPEDLSLITWELPAVSQLAAVPLTTVGQDFQKIAFHAVELLESHFRENPIYRDILVPYRLNIRSSVGLPRN